MRIHLIPVLIALVIVAGCQREDIVGAKGATVAGWELTHEAVHLVLQEEQALVAIDRREGDIRLVEARYADGTEIAIDLKPLSRSTTHVTVQVGHLGQGVASRRLLEAIKREVRQLKDLKTQRRGLDAASGP